MPASRVLPSAAPAPCVLVAVGPLGPASGALVGALDALHLAALRPPASGAGLACFALGLREEVVGLAVVGGESVDVVAHGFYLRGLAFTKLC